jgi:uncharacterized protein YndB with AHSA1/START domain
VTLPVLELERHLDAPPDAVWQAWTDPAVMQQWYCPNPQWALVASTDLRTGGLWQVRMGDSHVAGGSYAVLDRPHRLAFTWRWESEDEPAASTVEVELSPDAAGTRLALRHSGLPDAGERESHQQGWTLCLDRLAETLS